MYSAGECVRIETNFYEDGNKKAHLFVVILDAKEDDDVTILIPMCSIPERGFYDPTTELKVGEHDYVKVPTYMNYNDGWIRNKKWIDANGKKRPPPVDTATFKRVCDGMTKTEHIRNDVYDAYLFRKS